MNTDEFFKALEEKGFDTSRLDVANLRNYLSVVSEDRKREYSEVMRLMQHKEELGFLGYGDDVMLEFSIEPSDDGVTPGIHIDLLNVTDSSKEEYIRLNDVPYAHEDYTFCNVFECDSMEEFVGSVEELQTNIWPKYLKPTKSQEQEWVRLNNELIGRKISDDIFEFAEIHPLSDGEDPDFVVATGKININNYSNDAIQETISEFGYINVEEIRDDLSKLTDKKTTVNQVIAECIFKLKHTKDLEFLSPKLLYDDAVEYLYGIQKGEIKDATSDKLVQQEWIFLSEKIAHKIRDDVFEFAAIRDINPATGDVDPDYVVVTGKIDLKDYSREQILDAISEIGFYSIKEIENHVSTLPEPKPTVNQIIAESIFDNTDNKDLGLSKKFSYLDDAMNYLHEFPKGKLKEAISYKEQEPVLTQENYQKSLEKAEAFDENLDNEKLIEFFNKRGQGFPRQPQDLGEIYFGENYNTAISMTVAGGDEPVMMLKVMSRSDFTDEPDTTAYIPNVGNIQYEDISLENMPLKDYQDLDSVFNHLKVTYPSHFKAPIYLSVYSKNKEGGSLTDAGNWHIDGKELGSVTFGEREIPPGGVYLGHVGYGDSLIQLHCVPNTEESKEGQLRISVEKYAPTMDALNPDSETKNYHLAVNDHMKLWTERVSEVPVIKTEFFCEPSKVSLDSFKEKAVAKMVEAEIISPDKSKEYKQLTEDNMDFASQVYEQDSKIEMYKSLGMLRPVNIIKQDKLMPDDIDTLSVYYDQVAECLADRNGLADATERVVNEMKKDGLDNTRIGLVFKASEKLRDCLLEKGLASITQHQTQQNRADSSKTR